MKIIEPDKQTGWPSHMRADISQGQLIALRDELARLKAERRWIPVGERLPECGPQYTFSKDVIINFLLEDIWCLDIGYLRIDGEWLCYSNGETQTVKVSHWMPLPEPPEIEV